VKTDPATPVTPDLEQLRGEYNAAVANGLLIKARQQINRVIQAMNPRDTEPDDPPPDFGQQLKP
jgi:hypothetical protein